MDDPNRPPLVETDQQQTLIQRIRLEMFRRGENQRQFALVLGVQVSRLNEILNGKRQPNLDFIRRLWKIAGMDADELLTLK